VSEPPCGVVRTPRLSPAVPPPSRLQLDWPQPRFICMPQVFMQHGLPRHLLGIMSALHLKPMEPQRPGISSCGWWLAGDINDDPWPSSGQQRRRGGYIRNVGH